MSKKNKRYNRKYNAPAGAKTMSITPAMMAKMQAMMAPQSDQASAFSPGAPIPPTPGVTLKNGPRQWTFPIGYNIGELPRMTESTSFDTLRSLASLYDGIMLCQQTWFDLCSKLEPQIKPTEEALAAAGGDEAVFAADIAKYKAFFAYPDPDNDLDLKSWMIQAIKEQLEIDAVAIYVRPTRDGGVYSLEIVDGATIKPLIDERGRRPQPPYPAYQQYWYGVPLDMYTKDQMIYMRETTRVDSVYGLSRVERIIMRVNQALRKQNKDMSRFTEGNLPAGILEMPPNPDNEWTPELLMLYQQVWDGVLAGNDSSKSRLKVVEPGAKFTSVDDPDIMTPFDSFILNTCAACHGLTMAELGFTESVNKSSGDSQEAVVYRRAMRPLMNRYAQLFTMIIRKYFHDDRFVFAWTGFEEAEDLVSKANAFKTMIAAGIMSPSTAAAMMKYPVEIEIPIFYTTANGPIFFEDLLDPALRKAQKDAKMKGFELAQQGQPPGGKPPSGGAPGEEPDAPQDKADPDADVPEDDDKSDADTTRVSQPTSGASVTMDWQDKDPDVQKAMNKLVTRGVKKIKWNCSKTCCDACRENDGQVVAVGQRFYSGAVYVPQHGHCNCEIVEVE